MVPGSVTVNPMERQEQLLTVLSKAFGASYNETDTRATLSSSRFNPTDCFICEKDRLPIGSVAVTSLPRDNWYVIRYLAVTTSKNKKNLARSLAKTALKHAMTKGAESIRASTPTIEPYLDVYEELGFVPLRKDFRISWDLTIGQRIENRRLTVVRVSEDNIRDAAQMFVRTLTPFWEWRTAEQGGPEKVVRTFHEGLGRGEKWFLCLMDGEPIGLTGMILDFYGRGKARFRGAYVLPESRRKGFGREVMSEAMTLARAFRQDRMTIYTFSYLNHLSPGARLYLGSGGRIEAEYIQLAPRTQPPETLDTSPR